jgi:hypothetical protein
MGRMFYIAAGGTCTGANYLNADGLTYPGGFLSVVTHNDIVVGNYQAGDTFVIDGSYGVIRVSSGDSGEQLIPRGAAGTQAEPITYVGINNAILSAASLIGDVWVNESGSLWYAPVGTITTLRQAFFNDVRGVQVALKGDLTEEFEWWFDNPNDRIYVYSPTDPFDRYTGRGVEITTSASRITCLNYAAGSKNWHVFENIQLEKSLEYSLSIYNISIDGVTLRSIRLRNGFYAGGRVFGDEGGAGITNALIEDLETAYNGGSGFNLGGNITDFVQRRTWSHHCCHYEDQTLPGEASPLAPHTFTAGIKFTGPVTGLAEQCLSEYQNTTWHGTPTTSGSGVHFDVECYSGITFRNSCVRHNSGEGINIEIAKYVKCYSNLVYDNRYGISLHCNNGVLAGAEMGECQYNEVYNNTIYETNRPISLGGGDPLNQIRNNTVKNNIAICPLNQALYLTNGGDNNGALLSLATALTTAGVTQIDVGAGNIRSGISATGKLSVKLNNDTWADALPADRNDNGINYTSHDGNRYFTIAAFDFSGANNASVGRPVTVNGGVDNVIGPNCLGANAKISISGVGDKTYAEAETAMDLLQPNMFLRNPAIEADPLFENPAAEQFWLQPTSPCIKGGVNLGSDYRRGLHKASTWPNDVRTVGQSGLWDVGAYPSGAAEGMARATRWSWFFTGRRHG